MGSAESKMAYLEEKYFEILTSNYGLRRDQVSNEVRPELPEIKSLLAVQDHFSKLKAPTNGIRIYNGYWRLLLDDAVAALPRATGIHDTAIYIGEIPDPVFNAGVRDFGEERFLIGIQSGLELFLYRIAVVVAGSMRLRIGPSGPEQTVLEPEIEMETARSIVTRNIRAVFRGNHEKPPILKSESTLGLAAKYAYALQQFVIAHEIGHILQSVRPYANSSGTERKPALKDKTDLQQPWNKELVADALAQKVCHELVDTVASKGHMDTDLAAKLLFEAPYIIFGLMEAMDAIAKASGIGDWKTHPPAELRKSKLLSLQITNKLSGYYQELAEERSRHIGLLTGLVTD